jgi:hypothetical protein
MPPAILPKIFANLFRALVTLQVAISHGVLKKMRKFNLVLIAENSPNISI